MKAHFTPSFCPGSPRASRPERHLGPQLNIIPQKRTAVMVLLCLLLASAAFARKVKTVAGPSENFAVYKTYRWLPVKTLGKTGIAEDDPEIAPVIRQAVNRELANKGLIEVGEGADLEIATFATITYIPQLEAAVASPGAVWLEFPMPIATMGRYNKEGALAINLIDAKTNQSAWAGIVSDNIDNKQGSGLKKIPSATTALFRKYPVRK